MAFSLSRATRIFSAGVFVLKLNKQSILYGTLTLTGVNLISQLLGFVYRIALSRLIGAEGIGLFQLVFPVYSVAMSVTVSGLAVCVSRLSAEYTALENSAAVKKLVKLALCAFPILLLPLAGAVLLFSDGISTAVLGDARTQAGIVLLLPCILLTGLENIHKNYFYGVKRIRPPAISELTEQLVRMTAVLSLLFFLRPDHGEAVVAFIVLGMIICELFSASLLRFFYRRDLRRVTNTGHAPETSVLAGKMLRIALPVMLTSLLGTLLGSANALLIPARLAASGLTHQQALSSFGVLFGMTLQLLGLPYAFMSALSLIMMPRLAESNALRHFKTLRLRIGKTLRATGLFVFPVTALLAFFGPALTVWLFREPDAGAHFLLLCIGMGAGCFQMITGSILNAVGRQARAAVNFFAGGVIQLTATYYLTALPGVRLEGYAWASLIGTLTTLALNFACLYGALGAERRRHA